MKAAFWKSVLACTCVAFLTHADAATTDDHPSKPIPVRHPNLLLNQSEIDQVKLKIRDQPWAAHLLELVKAKAEKDTAIPETALAYALTGKTNYAASVRRRLLAEARE